MGDTVSSSDPLTAIPPEKSNLAPIELDDASPVDVTPVIPGYRVEKRISGGAMGQVYLATQDTLERPVAIKVMSPSLSIDATFRQRFLKEGKILAHLRHPHIVTIHDIGECLNQYYMVMEYVEGGTLRERIDKGLTAEQSANILRQVASALGHAHRQGFIHRDIKPANILFRDDDNAVLSDFGIAKAYEDRSHLTETGFAVGTIRYMSPEQAQGVALDGRSDLYSLGLVFLEMLTGSRPNRTLDGYVESLPPALYRYRGLVNKLLAAHPDERFANAEELIKALDQIEQSDPAEDTIIVAQPGRSAAVKRAARWPNSLIIGSALVATGLLASVGYYFWDRSAALDTASDPVSASVSSSAPASVPSPTLVLQVSYFYRSPEQQDFQPLLNDGVLHSGDHYQIRFTLDGPGYAYVFQTDSSGAIYLLYPLSDSTGEAGQKNPAQPHVTYYLPAPDQAFQLDEQVGQEQIRFLAFKERHLKLEAEYAALAEARQAQDPVRIVAQQAQLLQSLQSTRADAISILNFRHHPRGSHEL